MNFFNEHPGIIYVAVTLVELVTLIVIAVSLARIANILSKKKEK